MSEDKKDKNEQKPVDPNLPSPHSIPRNRTNQQDGPDVKFAETEISEEKLESLRKFLLNASPEDIKVIRDCYGDNPHVLKLIGLGIADNQSVDSEGSE